MKSPKMMENPNTDWSRTTRYIASVILVLFGIFIIFLSRPVIPLLIIAGLMAVIVRPIILWLHHRAHLPLGLAVALVYLVIAFLLPLGLLLAVPAVLDTARFILNLDYSTILRNIIEWLRSNLIAIKDLPVPDGGLDLYIDQIADTLLIEIGRTTITESPQTSIDTIIRSLGTALSATFRTAAGVVESLFSRLALIFITYLVSIYISMSAHTFHGSIMRAVPDRFKSEIMVLIARIVQVWNAFFRGQVVLMLLIGVITWVGLTILGVHGAPYLGIVAGLLEIIPNIGPIIATIPAIIVALLQGSTYLAVDPIIMALIVLLFYILVQQLENNLIVPKVLGQAVNLPALVVMVGVFTGARIGGLLGALLATPVIATLREIMQYTYRKILGVNPFPPEEDLQTPTAFSFSPIRNRLQKAYQMIKTLSNKLISKYFLRKRGSPSSSTSQNNAANESPENDKNNAAN